MMGGRSMISFPCKRHAIGCNTPLTISCIPLLHSDAKIIRCSHLGLDICRDVRYIADGVKCRSFSGSTSNGNGDDRSLPLLSPDGIIDPDGTIIKQSPRDIETKKKLWKAAIKLPMYSVGVAPILVSATAAFVYNNSFMPLRTIALCFCAIAIIAWLNLTNDVFDSRTGVDGGNNKPESVVNLTKRPLLVFIVAHIFLLVGGGCLFQIISSVPHPWVSKALYAAICCGYLYQGPPFRWSYLGLGEILCFVAFGPLATNAFYLAQVDPALATPALGASPLSVIPGFMIALSTLIGVSTTVILFCSHFHQVEGDRKAGKMSPLVRIGTKQGASVLKFTVGATYAVTLVLSLFGILPFSVWTSAMVAYGFAREMVKLAESSFDDDAALKPLKLLATKWHIAFSAMLCLGLVVHKLMII